MFGCWKWRPSGFDRFFLKHELSHDKMPFYAFPKHGVTFTPYMDTISRAVDVVLLVRWKNNSVLLLFWGFFYPPTRDIFTHLETSPLPVKGYKFWPTLTYAIEQWRFFYVIHLLWHGPTPYNRHLRGPAIYTRTFDCGTVNTCFNDFHAGVSDRQSNPDLTHSRRTLYHYATETVLTMRDTAKEYCHQ